MNPYIIYPVITLYQPWATYIMLGLKTIETRTHNRFAGLKGKTILIHAGNYIDDSEEAMINPYVSIENLNKAKNALHTGLLGSAFVYDAGPLQAHHSLPALIDCSATTRFGLFLSKIDVFETPIPCKGAMGIWYYDLAKRERVLKPAA